MKFGDFEIRSFVEQRVRMDGGLMFGVIPKVMWNKLSPADEKNFIAMATNIFVLQAHGHTMIFDSGLGGPLSDLEKKMYDADGVSHMERGLASLGLSVADIDYVILSHLHKDHAGGTVIEKDGQFVPRFPKAKVIASKEEWQVALNPDERSSAAYSTERLNVLKDSGRLELVDPATELFPGITYVPTGGHTAGHCAIEIESGGKRVWFYGDVHPTRHHLKPTYVMSFDLYPMQTMTVRQKTLPQLINEDIILAFPHDPEVPLATVQQQEKKIIVSPVDVQ